jgi:putative transposase
MNGGTQPTSLRTALGREGDCYIKRAGCVVLGKLKIATVNHAKVMFKRKAERAIFEYVEMFYNRKRLHAAVSYVSPVGFEEGCVR